MTNLSVLSILPPPRKLTFVKLSFFAALFVAAALWCAVCQADIVMSLTKITGETAEAVEAQLTNVPNYSSVKYAINYGGQTVSDPIGGVTFVNMGGNAYYTVISYTDEDGNTVRNGYNTPQQSYTSRNTVEMASHGGNTYTGTTSSGLNTLLGSMININQPANSSMELAFGNLEEGKTYTARILARSYGTSTATRLHTFSIDLDADGVGDTFTYNGNQVTSQLVSEDQPFSGETYTGAYSVDFTFTAQSNTAMINLLCGDQSNMSWHNYGVMLIESSDERQAATPTIYNGSFEADKWTLKGNADNGHTYLDGKNTGVISGWQFTSMTNNEVRAGLQWVGGPCQDFLKNQTPPDGKQVAWLQSNKTDSRLYQNVYGFNPEDKDTVYRVSMELGTRGTNKPSFSLYIGEDQTTEKAYISSKEVPSGKFTTYGAVFAPNAETQAIAIGNNTNGDNTLLIDNVQLQAYELTTFFTDNYKVTNNRSGSNIGMDSQHDAADRFGGLLGALGYVVRGNASQTQVGHNYSKTPYDACSECNNHCIDSLFLVAKTGYTESHASPNYDFANVGAMSAADEGGRMYDVSFRVAPATDTSLDTNWAAVIFGTTQDNQTKTVNGSNGVGILFRRNGGLQIFDGTGSSNSCIVDKPAGTFSLYDDYWADVRLVYYVPAFDGASQVEASLYINDTFITSFTTASGFNSNYIHFEGYAGDSAWVHSFITDLSIKATAEFQYDVSRIQDMNREWAPNGKDKLDVFFNAPRSDTGTEAVHTGALTLDDNVEINVDDGYTLKQTGDISGNHTITKTGDGVLQIYGAAAGDVDIESLVISSGRVDVKGYMTGSVLVGSDATFSPGNSVGTVVIDGEFQTEPYATLLFEQDASGMDSLTASSLNLDDNTQFVLDITAIVPGATYDIIISSDEEFTEADSVWLDKLSEIVPDYFDFSIVDNHIVRLYTNPNKVPEPSTWALLVLGIVVLLLRKRS